MGTTGYSILFGTDGRLELSKEGDGVVARFEEKAILDVKWVATEVVNKHKEGGRNSGYPSGIQSPQTWTLL